jgi:hypothetical protein
VKNEQKDKLVINNSEKLNNFNKNLQFMKLYNKIAENKNMDIDSTIDLKKEILQVEVNLEQFNSIIQYPKNFDNSSFNFG